MQPPLHSSHRAVRPYLPQVQQCLSGLLLGALLLLPTPVIAQGFGFYEQGTCAMGRSGATVAAPCDDGSAVFFNPAGLVGARELTFTGGLTVLFADGSFTTDRTRTVTDLANDAIPIPHAYLRYGINDRFAVGIGGYVPYGLATQWPIDFSGRFVGYDNQLQSIYLQPTAAVQLTDRITLGGGLTIVFSSVELNQRLDLSQQRIPFEIPTSIVPESVDRPITFAQLGIPPETDFASATLDADGATGVGGHFGVQVKLTDWLALGARYMLRVPLDYDGDARFEQVPSGITIPAELELGAISLPPGTPLDLILEPQFVQDGVLRNQSVETEITMPDQIAVGIQLKLLPRVALYVDYQWVNWSTFDRVPLDFQEDALDSERIENFNDTNALRLGADFAVTPRFDLRAGYIRHGPAAPPEVVTPLLPDGTRNELTAGFSWRVLEPVEVSLAYQYLQQNDRRGRSLDPEPSQPPTEDLNNGLYTFGAHLAGVSLSLHL